MSKTKIVCTIGPSSQDEETLRKIMLAGMHVARLNFSHGDHHEQGQKLEMIRKLARELQMPVAVLMDTRGPEIRLGQFADGRVLLQAGQRFVLTAETVSGTAERVSVSYTKLPQDVQPGQIILIDDGLVALRTEQVTDTEIVCKVLNDGQISDRKGVNLPGAKLNMPFLSEKDRADIQYAAEQGFDFIAASFVRTKEDILQIREILNACSAKTQIIAKIECLQALDNIEEILAVSDGLMVARGDLGVEIALEDVPSVQKRLIAMAVQAGKHVITATQMLDSMMKNPRPTRAEVTDVANAIYDGTTAIMLSGETANGAYPAEAAATMARIAERTEQELGWRTAAIGACNPRIDAATATAACNTRIDAATATGAHNMLIDAATTEAICHATCTIAARLHAAAIITVTMTGFTSAMVARHKPGCRIISCTTSRMVWRQMNLQWGVSPLLIAQENTTEDLFREAVDAAVRAGFVKKGDTVILTAGLPLGEAGRTNMLRIVEIKD